MDSSRKDGDSVISLDVRFNTKYKVYIDKNEIKIPRWIMAILFPDIVAGVDS